MGQPHYRVLRIQQHTNQTGSPFKTQRDCHIRNAVRIKLHRIMELIASNMENVHRILA